MLKQDCALVLVLSGGKALGTYQAGAYASLQEHGLEPDWLAGASIGAINASIICGNIAKRRLPHLREFWGIDDRPFVPGGHWAAFEESRRTGAAMITLASGRRGNSFRANCSDRGGTRLQTLNPRACTTRRRPGAHWKNESISRCSMPVSALLGAASGLTVVLLNGRIMAGRLQTVVTAFPSSQFRLDKLGRMLGERGFGSNGRLITAAFEGAVFVLSLVTALHHSLRGNTTDQRSAVGV